MVSLRSWYTTFFISASAILLGSVRRSQMEKLLEEHVGEHSRHMEAERRRRENPVAKMFLQTETESAEPDNATSTERIPQRKGSRFQVRRVKSQDALHDALTAVQRKDAIRLPAESSSAGSEKKKDGQQLLQVPSVHSPGQPMDGHLNHTGTMHSVSSKKFLDTVHAVGSKWCFCQQQGSMFSILIFQTTCIRYLINCECRYGEVRPPSTITSTTCRHWRYAKQIYFLCLRLQFWPF